MTEMIQLTDKQRVFCEEYLKDLNANQAAIRAGYSEDSARTIGPENLSKPAVADFIAKLQAERSARTRIDADWVLSQSVKLHQRCMNEIEVYRDRKGDPILDEHGELQYVFNASGAARALELVGKHVNVKAFQDTIKLEGGLAVTLSYDPSKLSDDQLAALASIPVGDDASKVK